MAGTYTQIYIHYVFPVKFRKKLLQKPWREEVFKYISGIITEKGQKSIIVNGVSDHIHILIGLKPSMNISDLARDIKNNSSKFINDRKFLSEKFAWQSGFGAFSYAQSEIKRVYKYIENQEVHHKEQSLKQEYVGLLKKFEIDYDEKYLF